MTENTLQLISGLKILVVTVFAMLYGSGGISGKWKRRFVAPAVWGAGITGLTLWTSSFHWQYLLCVPLLFGALSLGYGASGTSEKVKKRAIAGFAAACCFLLLFITTGAYTLLFLNIAVSVSISIVAGVWNQTSSARAEETLIGAMYVLIPTLTV